MSKRRSLYDLKTLAKQCSLARLGQSAIALLVLASCLPENSGVKVTGLRNVSVGSTSVSAAPSSLTLTTPLSATGSLDTPVITVSGVQDGDEVGLYTSPTCSSGSLIGSATATGTTVAITSSTLTVGTHTFYARRASTASGVSACSTASTTYVFKNPEFTLSRDNYSISDDGSSIGTTITITRDAPGATHAVTLTADAVTASGSNVTLGSTVFTFNANDTTQTVPVSTFSPVTSGSIQGDRFFRIKLGSPTNSATVGTLYESTVNLIDTQIDRQFFFSSPLYSVNENGSSAKIIVQRSGVTTASATVVLDFINGTATASTDFTNTAQTLTFAAGESEVEASVPVFDNSSTRDNRSFYAILRTPSGSNLIRPWAITKIRILDNDDVTVCDSTNNSTGVNAGFGGGDGSTGDPYRICSLAQLDRVRNNLSSNFRVMSDLDLDPSLDADPATGGTQAFTPITGTFTGTFSGEERILKNFRVTTSSAFSNEVALFVVIGGNATTYVDGVNLMNLYNRNTHSGNSVGGIVGRANGVDRLSNNLVSGLVETTGGGTAGGVFNRSRDSNSDWFIRNFSHGHVVSQTGYAGGIYSGIYDASAEANLDYAFSTANVISISGSVGGIFGNINSITGFDSRVRSSRTTGVIISEGSAGGIAGAIYGNAADVRIESSVSNSIIRGGSEVGGLVGNFECNNGASCLMSQNITDADITMTSTGGTHQGGGLFGRMGLFSAMTIDSCETHGNITVDVAGGKAGGLVGYMSPYSSGAARAITISDTFSTGDVGVTSDSIGANQISGGIADLTIGSGLNVTVTLDHVYSTGDITGSMTSNYNVGGIIGSATNSSSDGMNAMVFTDVYSTGDIKGYQQTGGVIGNLYWDSSTGGSIDITRAYSTGTITGTNQYTGGILGAAYLSGSLADLTIENSYSTGTITSSNESVGGILGQSRIEGSQNSITIQGSYATGAISGTNKLGGIAGYVNLTGGAGSSMVYTKTYFTGSISGESQLGGIAGETHCSANGAKNIKIEKSYATVSTITGTGQNIGGIAGVFSGYNSGCTGQILNTYSSGTIAGVGNVGGLVGQGGNGLNTYSLTYSYSRAAVSASSYNEQGLAGNHGSLTMSDNYWLKEGSHNSGLSNDGNQKTAAQLQDSSTYTGWDFGAIWNSPSSGVYPTLQ